MIFSILVQIKLLMLVRAWNHKYKHLNIYKMSDTKTWRSVNADKNDLLTYAAIALATIGMSNEAYQKPWHFSQNLDAASHLAVTPDEKELLAMRFGMIVGGANDGMMGLPTKTDNLLQNIIEGYKKSSGKKIYTFEADLQPLIDWMAKHDSDKRDKEAKKQVDAEATA